MTVADLIRAMGDIAGRFDITIDQATRIAEVAVKADDAEAEFVKIWENEAWWV